MNFYFLIVIIDARTHISPIHRLKCSYLLCLLYESFYMTPDLKIHGGQVWALRRPQNRFSSANPPPGKLIAWRFLHMVICGITVVLVLHIDSFLQDHVFYQLKHLLTVILSFLYLKYVLKSMDLSNYNQSDPPKGLL